MGAKLFVGNLNYQSSEETLREHFEKIGEVVEAKIIRDRNSGRSRGFAFVTMGSDDLANRAMSELQDSEMDGRNIRINEAKQREERPRFNNNRRSNYDDY